MLIFHFSPVLHCAVHLYHIDQLKNKGIELNMPVSEFIGVKIFIVIYPWNIPGQLSLAIFD